MNESDARNEESKMSRTCQNCVYGQVSKKDKTKIECHFYAPQKVHGVGTGYDADMWPLMNYTDWCASFYNNRRKPVQ